MPYAKKADKKAYDHVRNITHRAALKVSQANYYLENREEFSIRHKNWVKRPAAP